MKEDITNKVDDIEEVLRNTTAGQFRELGKAIQQIGTVTTEDITKAVQKLGVAMNAVPPYTRIETNRISIFHIVKVAVVVMAIASVLVYFICSIIK